MEGVGVVRQSFGSTTVGGRGGEMWLTEGFFLSIFFKFSAFIASAFNIC